MTPRTADLFPYLEVHNLETIDTFLEVCKPLKFSVEIVHVCGGGSGADHKSQSSSLGSK